MTGIGGHQSPRMETDTWLTPPWLIDRLCGDSSFDLDPCAAVGQPWKTADAHYTVLDGGLDRRWYGTVWLNPPYGRNTGAWLSRLSEHGEGVALIFARTETSMFFNWVWGRASAVLFLSGRLHFHRIDGSRAKANAGAPSALVAYGADGVRRLNDSGVAGALIEHWSADWRMQRSCL